MSFKEIGGCLQNRRPVRGRRLVPTALFRLGKTQGPVYSIDIRRLADSDDLIRLRGIDRRHLQTRDFLTADNCAC